MIANAANSNGTRSSIITIITERRHTKKAIIVTAKEKKPATPTT